MKILFIGLGSIGQRHLRNLMQIGFFEFYALRKRNHPLPEEFSCIDIKVINEINEIAEIKPNLCIIAAPPSFQQEVLPVVVNNGINFFIEKPIGVDITSLEKLTPIINQKNIISMVGFNLRFHPLFFKLKDIINSGILGNIVSIRAIVGQYLPDWHPLEDYTKGYSANKHLGGGAVLDLIHELDFVYGLMGPVKEVKAFTAQNSNLKIDVEDVAEIILRFKSGVLGSVHMDYVHRNGIREGLIIGDMGSVSYDLIKSEIIFTDKDGKIEKICYDFTRNDMYINELKKLLECIEKKQNPENNYESGIEVLKYASTALYNN